MAHLVTTVLTCYNCNLVLQLCRVGERRGADRPPPAGSQELGLFSLKTRRPWLNRISLQGHPICGGWGGRGLREPSQRLRHCREDLHWATLAFLFFSYPPSSPSHCSILSVFFLLPDSPHSLCRHAQLLSQQINIFLLQKAELDFLFTLIFLSCHI